MVHLDIKQRFILPASPWWGGFYERLVRSVKLSLRKTLGRSLLTYEELETVLCSIESVINNRPLTYVSEDDMDEPLTPYHLMFGRNAIQTPVTHENHDVNLCNVKRVRYLNTLLESYWKKFTSLYLNELRQKHIYIQRKASTKNILVKNYVVLIKDDRYLPRYRWRLGKVEDLITGRDGNVRGAKLKVVSNTGEVTTCYRPVQKLIPFEIAENLEKNDTTNDNEAIVSSMRPQRRAAVKDRYYDNLGKSTIELGGTLVPQGENVKNDDVISFKSLCYTYYVHVFYFMLVLRPLVFKKDELLVISELVENTRIFICFGFLALVSLEILLDSTCIFAVIHLFLLIPLSLL